MECLSLGIQLSQAPEVSPMQLRKRALSGLVLESLKVFVMDLKFSLVRKVEKNFWIWYGFFSTLAS